MQIGVGYNPEKYDKEQWQRDALLMAQTGVRVVKFGEYAWGAIEPSDGQFNFGWLDEAITLFSQHGLQIVLCTPAEHPPLWMTDKFSEIKRTGRDGRKSDGKCINSPVLTKYIQRLVAEMAKRYSTHPAVVVWQIGCDADPPHCCCDECAEEFRMWLREKYDNKIERLNSIYSDNAKCSEYTNWKQIFPPANHGQNPSLVLDWYRFTWFSYTRYIESQLHIIRQYNPKTAVTLKTAPAEFLPDYYTMQRLMSFSMCVNEPPTQLPMNPEEFYTNAFWLDTVRGIKGRNFWVTEQLSGIISKGGTMSRGLRPGMLKGYALQALAHGADTVIFYNWHTDVSGANTFRHGLLGHDKQPNRRFHEFAELCRTANSLKCVYNSKIISDIAIMYSPDCDTALNIQPQAEGFSYIEQLKSFYKGFTSLGANVDIIGPDADLSDYAIVVAPSLYVDNKVTSENVYKYVVAGGTLVLTCRSGVKDRNNNCVSDSLPAVFKELIGAEIIEYDPIGNGFQTVADSDGDLYICRHWCDVLKLSSASALAEYSDGFYKGMPAITVNEYCKGAAYYVGTVPDANFFEVFTDKLMGDCELPRLRNMPYGVEVTTRTDGYDDFIFFFNNSSEPCSINLPKAMFSVIDGIGKDRLDLKPFETEVVRR